MLRYVGDFNHLARFGFTVHLDPLTGRPRFLWCNGETFDSEDDDNDCVIIEHDGSISFNYWDADAVALLVFDLTVHGLLRRFQ
jgi:hypothetical protein